jgi:glycosyl transferase family 25
LKIFVINLDRAIARRTAIESQLKDLNLDFEIFPAISPSSANEIQKDYYCSQSQAKKILARTMTFGELGCALSHISIYQKMLRDNLKEALILEDDAKCSERTPEILEQLSENRNWEMVLLGHWSLNQDSMRKGSELSLVGRELICDRIIGRPAEFSLGAHAYAVKRSAAIKLLKYFTPIRMPADYVTGGAEMALVDLKLISPPVVTQQSEVSTIGERSWGGNNNNTKKYINALKRVIRKTLLFTRKFGIFRKTYVWLFNPRFQ